MAMAVFLATDYYEHAKELNTIGVTTLLGSVRSTILSSRVTDAEATVDVSTLLASRLGTALHDGLEKAWLHPKLPEVLESLDYPRSFIDRVNVNGKSITETQSDERDFEVVLERRTSRDINGWTISGQLDLSIDGTLSDLKSTGTFAFGKSSKEKDYILQLSIYKWLNPDLIFDERGNILFWFKDWNKNYVYGAKPYPAQPILEVPFNLMSDSAVEDYIINKTTLLTDYLNAPEETLPECTKEELWQGDDVFKYYGKNDAVKASKVFNSKNEALNHQLTKGKGYVKTFPAVPMKCYYCSGASRCSQYTKHVQQGLIKSGD